MNRWSIIAANASGAMVYFKQCGLGLAATVDQIGLHTTYKALGLSAWGY